MGKSRVEITERDINIFNIIKKFGYIREDFLAKFLSMNYNDKIKDVLRKLAERLSKYKFIKRTKILHNGSLYWLLDKNGAAFIMGDAIKDLSLHTITHNDLVTQYAIDYLINFPKHEIQTEFELKKQLYAKQAKTIKFPDLIINQNTAIEIELSSKNDKRINNIISAYLNSKFTHVIYFINNKAIANKIYKLSKQNSIFKFKLFNESILNSQDYLPDLSNIQDDYRNNTTGMYSSDVKERLKKLRDS